MKCLKPAFCLFIVAGLLIANSPVAFSQEQQEEAVLNTKEVSGQISAVDTAASTLTVKQIGDAATQTYEDIIISVKDITMIEKNYEKIDIAALAAGDEVTAEYTTDVEGNNVASYIWVKSNE